ncbi:uncharacterized protein BO80DRAFT_94508 [Aspergillus ibericus CBS 121593]|uniref:Uncharacterized protein n=1 Tax=Aspergillus ibericus CBS 121593 TaxID=1448316 RepID=A0A395GZ91_9EURO|nr:hypothetical protein BO80DRAFT_94508 [Aspergillus ibericus CBS 121593]RAL00653.1 hypothetical protein BO80DRAFT_94508 [Aspergillus ibericus CBS 121593]
MKLNPEVLQLNIIEIEDDNGEYANTWLLFQVDPEEYIGRKVLVVPRCCQRRKGSQDRWRVNAMVYQRERGEERLLGWEEFGRLVLAWEKEKEERGEGEGEGK